MNCPSCGNLITSPGVFCVNCGAKLPGEPSSEGAPAIIDLTEAHAAAPAKHRVNGARRASGSRRATAPPAPPPPAKPPAPDLSVEFTPPSEVEEAPAAEAAPEHVAAQPPPATRRPVPWRGIGIAAAIAVFAVFDVLAFANQDDRVLGLVFLGGAAIIAIALIGLVAVRRPRAIGHISRLPLAIALVAALGGTAVPVAVLSCSERLRPGGDLAGCSLTGDDLRGKDLTGANLRGSSLSGANLTAVRFEGANLTDAKFDRVRATTARFTNATLDGATFEDATLNGASFAGVSGSGVSFESAQLSDAVFSAAKLPEANFSGATLPGADFAGAVATKANFTGADLADARLDSADLSGATLKDAKLIGASMGGVVIAGGDLTGADLSRVILERGNLSGATLDRANLSGADLTDADLSGATLGASDLGSANLTRADLSNVRANGTDLSGARLSGAKLSGATLANVNLDRSTLIGSVGLSDRSLAQGVGATLAGLGPYLTTHTIRLEERDAILAAAGGVCRGGRIANGSGVAGARHPLVILNAQGRSFDWTQNAAGAGWEPMASRFTQYVACVQQGETVVQQCRYQEVGGLGRPGLITRYREFARLRVLDARTGRSAFDRTLQGSTPGACPVVTGFQSNGRIEGSSVGFSAFRSTLTTYAGTGAV